MKHMIMKWLGMISWFIASLGAINLGLRPFGFDIFSTDFMLINMSQFIIPIYYVVLVSGLISLATFVMMLAGHCSCNGHSSCGCK